MITKPLEQIVEADFQTLISNAVREGRTIEYKGTLPGNADADKREFLADVSSFSNTAGGDLIYGAEEDQGALTRVVGLAMADADLEIRRLESTIADGLEPRIRYSLRLVPCSGGPVLIIRTEKSWIGPHRVIFRGHDKFYGRNAAGKYPLDVTELRAAFTLASGIREKIRAFRTDRIIALNNNETPMPLVAGAKIVLHLLPIESFAAPAQYDVLRYMRSRLSLPPMASSAYDMRINLEGVVSFGGRPTAHAYTQVYRSGIIEAVEGSLLNSERQGIGMIPSIAYEQRLVEYLDRCLAILRELGLVPPVVVALTLTGVRGLRMSDDMLEDNYPINQDTLILPEAWVDDLNASPEKTLKPMVDCVWNACGYEKSKNFDDQGNWIQRR